MGIRLKDRTKSATSKHKASGSHHVARDDSYATLTKQLSENLLEQDPGSPAHMFGSLIHLWSSSADDNDLLAAMQLGSNDSEEEVATKPSDEGAYYDLASMPSVIPDTLSKVHLRWADLASPFYEPCPFKDQKNPKCDVPATIGGRVIEGFDVSGATSRTEDITAFYDLSSHCRFNDVSVHGDSFDVEGVRRHVKTLIGKDYSDDELLTFLKSVAFMSEIQLRLPEVLADKAENFTNNFIPSVDGSPLPKNFWDPRKLSQKRDGGTVELKYSVHYECNPNNAIKESVVLQDLGCQNMRFYRPPNYLRALVVACTTSDGKVVPLAENKGSGLPLFAPHTKNPNGWITGITNQAKRFAFGQEARAWDVHFALERGIERWRLSDHGSGTIDLDEALWELALEKYVEHTVQSPQFKEVRSYTCLFMLAYLKRIYGEEGFQYRMRHPIYGNLLPTSLLNEQACYVEIDTVPHWAALSSGWQGQGNNGNVELGMLIRGVSKRSFDSYFSEPDISGHPGANHHIAGIAAGLFGVGGILPQTVIDLTANKQMKSSTMGGWVVRWLEKNHVSKGKFFYLNIQSDKERRRLFDYGHVGIRKPDQQFAYLTRTENTYSKREVDTAGKLLSYWRDGFPDSSEFAIAKDTNAVVIRLLDVWLEYNRKALGPGEDVEETVWMFNQVLYWDPMLAFILTHYLLSVQEASDTAQAFANVLLKAEERQSGVGKCQIVRTLLQPMLLRYREFTYGRWKERLFDNSLVKVDWMNIFLDTIAERDPSNGVVLNTVCDCMRESPSGPFSSCVRLQGSA